MKSTLCGLGSVYIKINFFKVFVLFYFTVFRYGKNRK